jgi:hypothetical protein
MDKIVLVIAVVGVVAFFKGPTSQEEIAVSYLNEASQAIDKGDMLKACITLSKAYMTYDQRISGGKAQAAEIKPAMNKACNG